MTAAILSHSSKILFSSQTRQDIDNFFKQFTLLSPGESRHHQNYWLHQRTERLEIRKSLRNGSEVQTICSSQRTALCASPSPRRLSTWASLWRIELSLNSLKHHWQRQAYRQFHQILKRWGSKLSKTLTEFKAMCLAGHLGLRSTCQEALLLSALSFTFDRTFGPEQRFFLQDCLFDSKKFFLLACVVMSLRKSNSIWPHL